MKTQQGTYKPKNKKKYDGDWTNIVYRSSWELRAFKWCDNNPEVVEWNSEEIVVPYLYEIDKRYHRYFIDLKIKMTNGNVYLVEIKPAVQTKPPKNPGRKTKRFLNESFTYVKNQNKWKAAEKFANQRGWKFEIWTEDTLKSMGILPKGLKKMKPFRPKKK